MRDGVVWGAERPVADQGDIRRELVSHGINAGEVRRFLEAHTRQDDRYGPRQEGLAVSWWVNEKNIMRASHGYLPGTLDMLLSLDLAKIGK